MKNVDLLVLAPHEDDELAIAGPMIYQAVKNGQQVKVVFSTNGDYFPHEGPIRICEAIKSLHQLGVDREDIIFLGYGDQTQIKHLYNGSENEQIASYNGNTVTYGIEGVEEFAITEFGEHHAYTRANYKKDIKRVLEKYMPQIIITTDWDNHMDHLALSLMLDECMGELLKEQKEYKPLILKALSYTGKWEGYEDYYAEKNITEYVNLTCGIENVHPLNRWEDRLRFLVPKECRTTLLKDNVLYKAAKEYMSQYVDLKAVQFINQDLVFWRRRTEGLSYYAQITATSGNATYLNDFKCVDCSDIVNDWWNYDKGIWSPKPNDNQKRIDVEFDSEVVLSELHFYESPVVDGKIENMLVCFDDGTQIETGALYHDGRCTCIKLPKMKPVKVFSVTIEKYTGEQVGLTELEIYDTVKELAEYNIPLPLWTDGTIEVQAVNKAVKFEKAQMKFAKYARGRLWPDKYFLMKRYDTLQVDDSMGKYWYWYIRFVLEKVLEKLGRR